MVLDQDQFVSVNQAAKAFRMSSSSLRNSIYYEKPRLPGLTRMPNGKLAFFKSALIQHAKENGWVLILDDEQHA